MELSLFEKCQLSVVGFVPSARIAGNEGASLVTYPPILFSLSLLLLRAEILSGQWRMR